jgi:ribonucleoside-triphosphate reductase (thioredoxin)
LLNAFVYFDFEEIAFGEPDDEEYIDLKNYEKNPERAAYGWTSNNSIYARLGMDYEPACDRIRSNGEPGFAWLDNMRSFGRMNGRYFKANAVPQNVVCNYR